MCRGPQVHVPSTSEMIVTSLTGLLELDIDYVRHHRLLSLSVDFHPYLGLCTNLSFEKVRASGLH